MEIEGTDEADLLDYTVFLQYLGLASGNIGYSRKSTDPGLCFFFSWLFET